MSAAYQNMGTYRNMAAYRNITVAVLMILPTSCGTAFGAWDFLTLQEWLVTVEAAAIDDVGAAMCGVVGADTRVAVLRRAREAGADDKELQILAERYEQSTRERRQNEWAAYVAKTNSYPSRIDWLYPATDCAKRRFDRSEAKK